MSRYEKLDVMISWILVAGVAASLAVTTWALASYYLSNGPALALSDEYRVSSKSFFDYLLHMHKGGVAGAMAVGVAALMLTPYIRALASLIYFIAKRDIKYILITAFVFTILTISLLTS